MRLPAGEPTDGLHPFAVRGPDVTSSRGAGQCRKATGEVARLAALAALVTRWRLTCRAELVGAQVDRMLQITGGVTAARNVTPFRCSVTSAT